MTERRKHGRNRCLLGARVVTGAGSTISCVVRNHSDGGALLRFSGPQLIPAAFDMIVDRHDASAACDVAWRYGELTGVTFRRHGAMASLAAVASRREGERRQSSRGAKLARETGY
jgi:hypothetical protein